MSKNTVPVKRMTVAGRLIHWANAISILACVITGLYIGAPYYQSFIADPAVDKYVMAYNRLIHFVGAIILDVTSILIAYLYFLADLKSRTKSLSQIKKISASFGRFL